MARNCLTYSDTEGSIDSDIHGTCGFTFVIKGGKKEPLCYVRRYDFDSLCEFLRDEIGYEILEQRIVETANKVVNRGLFLLRRT